MKLIKYIIRTITILALVYIGFQLVNDFGLSLTLVSKIIAYLVTILIACILAQIVMWAWDL